MYHEDQPIFRYVLLAAIALTLAFLMCCGCTTIPQTQAEKPIPVAKAALLFKVDDVPYYGTALLDIKPSYVFTTVLPKDILKVYFATCHRAFDQAGYREGDIWKYTYYPVQAVEGTGSCITTIKTIDKNANVQTAIIDFKSKDELGMTLWCNGTVYIGRGALLCQARKDLVQSVTFDEPVKILAGSNCNEMIASTKENAYEFTMNEGLCLYTVQGRSGKLARVTVLGYSY
jgi:hypothetical protein